MLESGSTAIDIRRIKDDGMTIAHCYAYLMQCEITCIGKGEPKDIFQFARDQVSRLESRLERAELLASIYAAACEDYSGSACIVTIARDGASAVDCSLFGTQMEDVILKDHPAGPVSIILPAYFASQLWKDANFYAECLRRYRRDYVEILAAGIASRYITSDRMAHYSSSKAFDATKKAVNARNLVARLRLKLIPYQRIIDSRVKPAIRSNRLTAKSTS